MIDNIPEVNRAQLRYTSGQTARMLGISLAKLSKWRSEGGGPPYHKDCDEPSATSFYRHDDLVEWLDSKKQLENTSQL